jgi:YbbR domain-containing protein
LWLLINLGKDFTSTVEIPLEYGSFPDSVAPVERLPATTEVTFTGEGWQLLSLYGTPPRVQIDAEEGRINLEERIRAQMGGTGQAVSLGSVNPADVQIEMEEAISRKVPVRPRLNLNFVPQHNTVGDIQIQPDSVIVFGARSLVEPIPAWYTRPVTFDDLESDFTVSIELEETADLLQLSHNEVMVSAEVQEFTEGQMRVPVEIEGVPMRQEVVLSPSFVTIRYDVPLPQYNDSQDERLFRAYVRYADVEADTTGYVEPQIMIDDAELDIRLRSATPPRLSYFLIVD